MSKLRFRAALACRIVKLDRVKFNEAVSLGAYPCAPPTIAGKARIFNEEELLPLFFFARFLDFGLSLHLAGSLACEAASAARTSYYAHNDRITWVRGTIGQTMLAPTVQQHDGTVVAKYDPDHEKNGTHYPGLGRIVFSIDFYISHVRQIIADAIEEERSLLGEED